MLDNFDLVSENKNNARKWQSPLALMQMALVLAPLGQEIDCLGEKVDHLL